MWGSDSQRYHQQKWHKTENLACCSQSWGKGKGSQRKFSSLGQTDWKELSGDSICIFVGRDRGEGELALHEISLIIFSKTSLQFVSLLPEVTPLNNRKREIVSSLVALVLLVPLIKMTKPTYEILEFITVSFPLCLNQSRFISFNLTRLHENGIFFFLLPSISDIILLLKTQTVCSLGEFYPASANCTPEMDLK